MVALASWAVGAVMRSVVSRRAAMRSVAGAPREGFSVPCRLAWAAGIGKTGFVYGKLARGAAGVCFIRPLQRITHIPEGGRVSRNSHWRPGMQVLQYRTPDGGDLRILCYAADSDTIVRYLRVPDPADFS